MSLSYQARKAILELDRSDVLVVGAGFYGATIAERIANVLHKRVILIDRRGHIGGNAFTEVDPDTGIEIHRYGAHIFHTSNEAVWEYVHRFSKFTDYRHRVFASHKQQLYSMPINLETICQFFGRHVSPSEARALVEAGAGDARNTMPTNLEEKAISLIGRPLYEAFIRGYTAKQWQTDPRQLPESIITRLPVRYTLNNDYFVDRFQGMPENGYTAIFHKMLSNELISVYRDVDYFDVAEAIPDGFPVVFTGPIDRFFKNVDGPLGWRTIDFDFDVIDAEDAQGASVINYSDAHVPYTRVIEFQHFYPHRRRAVGKTIIAREFSRAATRADDEPYYPIDTAEDKKRYRRYAERAGREENVHFGGRLGTYRYLDMHQAIGAALRAFDQIFLPYFAGKRPSISGGIAGER